MQYLTPLQPTCTESPWRPLAYLFAIPLAQATLRGISHVLEHGVKGTAVQLVRRVAWCFPCTREKYRRKIDQQFHEFQESTKKKWKRFGPPHRVIPEVGLPDAQLRELVHDYERATIEVVGKQHLSGTIYPDDLRHEVSSIDHKATGPETEDLSTLAFRVSRLWNPLHMKEFAAGSFIFHQLVMMVASQFGGTPLNTTGYVTSGGTESLMTAARAYVKWGEKEKGIAPEDCVIVAPDSIHAALMKAQQAFRFKLVLVPTDESGRVDFVEFRRVARQHKSHLVALFGSTPSYSKGVIDPIKFMGQLAKQLNCGLHVDAGLGFLQVDFMIREQYLKTEGVTSLSADPHKGGLAPKGCSVVITRQMPIGRNLAFYPVFPVPGWSGGIYGTATNAGSQSCVSAFCAFLELLKRGKSEFQKLALEVHTTALSLHHLVISTLPELQSCGRPDAHVVAFKMNKTRGFAKGAIYAFTHLMEQRGFTCNNLADEAAHFCVTPRNALDPNFVEHFRNAAVASLVDLEPLNTQKKVLDFPFPGDAGIYGEMGAALKPSESDLSGSEYFENELFGKMRADDAVASCLVAASNPWLKQTD